MKPDLVTITGLIAAGCPGALIVFMLLAPRSWWQRRNTMSAEGERDGR